MINKLCKINKFVTSIILIDWELSNLSSAQIAVTLNPIVYTYKIESITI